MFNLTPVARTFIIAIIGAVFLVVTATECNGYVLFILALICANALMAIGFNFVIGFLGQLVFANTAFFGVGAYCYGILIFHFHLPFWAATACAAVIAGAFGAVVGMPALRIGGLQLAIVTLSVNELMHWIYVHSGSFGGGPSGLNLPVTHLFGPFGISLTSSRAIYIVVFVVSALFIWLAWNVMRSSTGRAIIAVGASPQVAGALTVSREAYTVIAFALSGFFSGAGGALFAFTLGRVAPESFGLTQLLFGFAVVMIGGLGTVWGPVLGAALLTAVPQFLSSFQGAEELIFSVLLVVLLLFMPAGLYGVVCRIWPPAREERHVGTPSLPC